MNRYVPNVSLPMKLPLGLDEIIPHQLCGGTEIISADSPAGHKERDE
jgi:hypothetical protein